MKKIFLLLTIFFMALGTVFSQDKEAIVLVQTDYGDIKLKLYNDTPLHRDNFLKLVKEGVYKDLLFHRVISNFIIQGGDPGSREISDTTKQGHRDLEYTIPAEIRYPHYFHKRGALAAARTGNSVNPEKASSSSQFYIVTGKRISAKELSNMEKVKVDRLIQDIYNGLQVERKATIKEFYSSGDMDGLASFRQGLYAQAHEEALKSDVLYTDEQKNIYEAIGGVPQLDKEYTVFGEVVEGMDVVDKIQKLKTDKSDRPYQNVKMNVVLLKDYQ